MSDMPGTRRRDADRRFDAGRDQRRRDPFAEHRRFAVEVDGEHGELVAADSGDDVARAHRLAQCLRRETEQQVAMKVAALVVDGLEIVEIHDRDHI